MVIKNNIIVMYSIKTRTNPTLIPLKIVIYILVNHILTHVVIDMLINSLGKSNNSPKIKQETLRNF